jgi:rubredoxin
MIKLSREQFERDKEKFRKELNIEVMIEYVYYKNNYSKYPYKCLVCGYEGEKTFKSLKKKVGCPVCLQGTIIKEDFEVTNLLNIKQKEDDNDTEDNYTDTSSKKKKSFIMKLLFRFKIFRKFFADKKVTKNFPDFIPKTDETRIQTAERTIEKLKYLPCEVTEKLDGSSITIYKKK